MEHEPPAADPGAVAGLRATLQAAIRVPHHRIDHHPLFAPLLDSRLSPRAYGDALFALWTLHHPVEAVLRAACPVGAPPPPRRADGLAADLARLGRRADLGSSRWPAWAGTKPDGADSYVGMRYVIEGSALGGRVIRRRLDLTLPPACRGATRFFDGEDGGASGEPASWAAFWRGVDGLGPIDAEAAAVAARRLFAEIEALWDRHLWLRRAGAR